VTHFLAAQPDQRPCSLLFHLVQTLAKQLNHLPAKLSPKLSRECVQYGPVQAAQQNKQVSRQRFLLD